MKILGINKITKFSFNGINTEKFDKQEKKVETLNNYHEGSDHFKKNIDAIEEQYRKDSEEASKKFFVGRAQNRVDEIYKAKKAVWMQDIDIFNKTKEENIAAVNALIEERRLKGDAVDEIYKLMEQQKACQRAIEIAKKQQVSNKKTGFNRIGGYEREKSILQQVLVNKIIDIEAGLPSELPNAVLLFGPTGTGKTTFAKALSEQISEDEKPVLIDASNDPYEIMDEIEIETRKARRRFDKEKKITLIILDEVEAIANQDSYVLDELKAKITKAAKEDKCVYIMTTNSPSLISKDILTPDRTKYMIGINPPDYDNIFAVVEYYFSNVEGSNVDYKKIAKEFNNCKNGRFSNSGIESVYDTCCVKKQLTTQQILDIIKSSEPNIKPNDLQEYNEDYKKFSREN